jgi:alanine racemase
MSNATAHRPTIAEINLDSLASNFHASKQFLGTDQKYMAVVKADAYGHGAVECALRLENEGIDWLGVAIPEEGVDLRGAGITTPILCLGSFWAGQESLLIENDLTPVIFDIDRAGSLSQVAATLDRNLDIHVKIDTGMGRAGIRHDEIATFVDALSRFKNLAVTGLMTHFAAADDPMQDEFTRLQIARFESACHLFRRAGYEPIIFDMANSPGAISYAESRGSMVRLGGALYGLLDDILRGDAPRPSLKPVLSLRSQIAHVKKIPKGESLAYGRTFTTTHDSLIALVPIGYADGYSRALSNKGRAIVNGRVVRVVGRVSMDWTLLDITDVTAKADDEVIFIGSDGQNEITAADLARELDTIGYEITCGISTRVPRVFK